MKIKTTQEILKETARKTFQEGEYKPSNEKWVSVDDILLYFENDKNADKDFIKELKEVINNE